MEWLLANEGQFRLYTLIGCFGIVAIWESLRPLRTLDQPIVRRWSINISLTILCNLLVHLLYPIVLAGVAGEFYSRGYGVYSLLERISAPVAIIAAVLIMDSGRYLQHFLLHKIPLLWRLHRTHHTDLDYDVTTGLRFHPLEAVFTGGFGLAIVLAVAPPPEVVLLYETAFIFIAMWSHGNLAIPESIDRAMRRILVTPAMHRVHHSSKNHEHNANYSGVISIWDRIFGTYVDKPEGGPVLMRIGLEGWRTRQDQAFFALLLNPFGGARQAEGVDAPTGKSETNNEAG